MSVRSDIDLPWSRRFGVLAFQHCGSVHCPPVGECRPGATSPSRGLGASEFLRFHVAETTSCPIAAQPSTSSDHPFPDVPRIAGGQPRARQELRRRYFATSNLRSQRAGTLVLLTWRTDIGSSGAAKSSRRRSTGEGQDFDVHVGGLSRCANCRHNSRTTKQKSFTFE